MLKQDKGITLIALIITIIVLLILSLVTIQSLGGSDSAPTKAQQASNQEALADQRESMTIAASDALINWNAGKYAGDQTVKDEIDNLYSQEKISSKEDVQGYVYLKVATVASINDVTIVKSEEKTETKGQYKFTIKKNGIKYEGTVNNKGSLTWGEKETYTDD